jgi:hypothetical protein
MRRLMALGTAGLMLVATGCTIRHSRTLDNAGPSSARRVSASSTGLEIFSIEVNDTESADKLAKQLSGGCKALKNVEADYRTMGILIVGIPKLTVSADCE